MAACIGLAMVVYRLGVANQAPTLQEMLPGMAANIERQRGILFGPAVAELMGWFDLLAQPIGQAALIIVAGLISAAVFYQVAHSIEVEEGSRPDSREGRQPRTLSGWWDR
jgi:hypothetical protein